MASIYDVADGDLFSPQQMDYARRQQIAGKKFIKDLKTKERVAVTKANDRRLSQPRGTGFTGRTSLPLTDADIQTILVLHGGGMPAKEIALKINRTVRKVNDIIAGAEASALKVGLNWKEIMKDKAVMAVNDALDHKDDLYKRGGLGIQALKGLGHFEQDGNLNINQIIDSVPPHMRDRYMELGDDPNVIDTTAKEIPDGNTE